MAPTPVHHPLRDPEAAVRRRAIAAHPAGSARTPVPTVPRSQHAPVAPVAPVASIAPAVGEPASPTPRISGEDGSMTTEYGLVIVVGATVCSLVIRWASGGAVFDLLGGVLDAAKGLVGF